MPKYVVSATLKDPDWSNSTVIDGDGDVVGEIRKLKEEFGGELQVAGSAQLAQTLIENDLVDEVRLMVFPVVLGRGKRFFGETSDRKPFKLTDSRTVGEGVGIQICQPARTGA